MFLALENGNSYNTKLFCAASAANSIKHFAVKGELFI
jgi:hypothetical protein